MSKSKNKRILATYNHIRNTGARIQDVIWQTAYEHHVKEEDVCGVVGLNYNVVVPFHCRDIPKSPDFTQRKT